MGGGVLGHVDDAPAMVDEHDEDEEDAVERKDPGLKSTRDANMDKSSFFPILWMNLITHRHYTSPEGSSGAVERVTRTARARHSASPIMTTSAGASGRTSPAGTVPTAASSRQSQ